MVSFKRYYILFGAAYIGFVIAFALVQVFLKTSIGGVSIVIPFLAAMITAERFVKWEQRAPDDQERDQLTLVSMGLFCLINLGFFLLAKSLFPNAMDALLSQPIGIGLVVVFIAFALAIVFFMMRWAYGSFIRKQAANILGKK